MLGVTVAKPNPWEVIPSIGVCGYPRCGSSMFMAMLEAGGIPPVDGSAARSYELLDGLSRANIAKAVVPGRAVKILDFVLHPDGGVKGIENPEVDWRFVWIDRDLRDQARSTVKFGRVIGGFDATGSENLLVASFVRDRPIALLRLRKIGPVLVLRYDEILRDPVAATEKLGEFVGIPTFSALPAAVVVHDRSPRCAPDLIFEGTGNVSPSVAR